MLFLFGMVIVVLSLFLGTTTVSVKACRKTTSSQGFSYCLLQHKKSWYDAKRVCEGHGLQLVSFTSNEEETRVREEMIETKNLVWTGLHKNQSVAEKCSGACGYVWADGTCPQYKNWPAEKCVVITEKTKQWKGRACDKKFHFICKEKGTSTMLSNFNLRRRANARNVSTSFLPYGGITYFIKPIKP